MAPMGRPLFFDLLLTLDIVSFWVLDSSKTLIPSGLGRFFSLYLFDYLKKHISQENALKICDYVLAYQVESTSLSSHHETNVILTLRKNCRPCIVEYM
jgi:hypothetical protein